jgi:N4-gp56 family major capsid protein
MAGQVWSVDAVGGYLANRKLSKTMRHATQPMFKFRQFTRAEKAIGKGKGDTVDFNKVSNIQTEGGTISEASRIPETNILIRRGTLVMEEYGNSIPYTGKLDDLSEFSVDNIITKALRDDMAKVLDAAVATQFKEADLMYIPTSASAATWDVDGTPSTTALANLNVFHVKEIVDAMKTGIFGANTGNPIPPYDGENYVCIASVKALRGIKDDPDFEEVVKYADPERLLNGEVGRYYGVRFIETNHTGALSNGVGTGSVLGEAVFFGADPVIEAIATAEEIRAKIPEDYGRSKGIAWYGLMGFKRVWDFSTDGEDHIVRVTSA